MKQLISESTTLEEFDKRLNDFRHSLYGRSTDDARDNMTYLAWCDGVEFGKKHALMLLQENK